MLKIAIVSDSHKRYKRAKKALDFLVSQGAQYIIHAGDIGTVEILDIIKGYGLPYSLVFGNNDIHLMEYALKYDIKSEPFYFKIEQTKFKLMHHPFYISPDVDVIVFGHTHNYECDFKNGRLYLNPGELCARNKPISEAVLLEISDEKYIINRYQRAIKTDEFVSQIEEFTR